MNEYDDSLEAATMFVEKLSSRDLYQWLRDRIFNREAILVSRQPEPSYFLVAKLYQVLDRDVQRDLERVYEQLIREVAAGGWPRDAAVNLLMLADPILLRPDVNYRSVDALRSVAVSDRMPEDVCLAALQSLVTIDYSAAPRFWLDILDARNERFLPTIVEALARTALAALEEWLLLRLPDVKIEEAVLGVLPFLVRRRGEDAVRMIGVVEPHMTESSRVRLATFVKRQKISFPAPGEAELAVRQAEVFRVLHRNEQAARPLAFAVALERYRQSLMQYTERISASPAKLLSLWRGYDTAVAAAFKDEALAALAAGDLTKTLLRWGADHLIHAVRRSVSESPGMPLIDELRETILYQVVQFQPDAPVALTSAERRAGVDYVSWDEREPATDEDILRVLEAMEVALA